MQRVKGYKSWIVLGSDRYLQQLVLGRVGGGFGAVGRVGFIHDISDVVGYSPQTDNQFFSYLPVALASRNQAQHFYLPLAQAIRIDWSTIRLGGCPLSTGNNPLHQGAHA